MVNEDNSLIPQSGIFTFIMIAIDVNNIKEKHEIQAIKRWPLPALYCSDCSHKKPIVDHLALSKIQKL